MLMIFLQKKKKFIYKNNSSLFILIQVAWIASIIMMAIGRFVCLDILPQDLHR